MKGVRAPLTLEKPAVLPAYAALGLALEIVFVAGLQLLEQLFALKVWIWVHVLEVQHQTFVQLYLAPLPNPLFHIVNQNRMLRIEVTRVDHYLQIAWFVPVDLIVSVRPHQNASFNITIEEALLNAARTQLKLPQHSGPRAETIELCKHGSARAPMRNSD